MGILWRVMASFLYDAVILFALSVLLSAIFSISLQTSYHEIDMYRWLFDGCWFVMVLSYFAFSWRYGGQTIGMKAWRLKVMVLNQTDQTDQTPLLWVHVIHRLTIGFLNALLLNIGWLGYLTASSMSLTDRFSGTFLRKT